MNNYLFLLLIFIGLSCSSAENKNNTETDTQKEEKLSRDKARELINEENDKIKNNVGGTTKIIKEFTVDSINGTDSIYTINYTWSGEITRPSVAPQEGEQYKGSDEVKNEKAELKVLRKDIKWVIIP